LGDEEGQTRNKKRERQNKQSKEATMPQTLEELKAMASGLLA
jgi:hypothetical protein